MDKQEDNPILNANRDLLREQIRAAIHRAKDQRTQCIANVINNIKAGPRTISHENSQDAMGTSYLIESIMADIQHYEEEEYGN